MMKKMMMKKKDEEEDDEEDDDGDAEDQKMKKWMMKGKGPQGDAVDRLHTQRYSQAWSRPERLPASSN
jgi:hypothetical protein